MYLSQNTLSIEQKIRILADSAKYDVSCSSSGSTRKNSPGGIGNAAVSGICHSWSDDGRCISLLKILFSNDCIYNCLFCVNRCSNDHPRATFTPMEIIDLTINFYRRNFIEGLFLSSAIIKSPDHTMELMLKTIRSLREDYRFNGYIHVKAIPGADSRLIAETGRYTDRMSVNIELPSQEGLKLLAPQKKKEAIIKPMSFISTQIHQAIEDKRCSSKAASFVPAGQSTQLIVGATPDRDLKILKLSENLYRRFHLKRVYYSAYIPVSSHPNLPALADPPLLREHRLYQADWLLRFYGFTADELLNDDSPNFDTLLDPKTDWALRNLHLFPLEVNKADFFLLLRVPGIGVRSAQRIVKARRVGSLRYEDLKKFGVVLKRAQFFLTCQGKYQGKLNMDEKILRWHLSSGSPKNNTVKEQWEQLSLFGTGAPLLPTTQDKLLSVTGEL